MKNIYKTILSVFSFFIIVYGISNCFVFEASAQNLKPNILWIVAEDMSAHLSCYGEKTISTPNLDNMAAEGIRFDNAFVTGPICSPSRSAMVTGMYQTVLGTHNHRSQRKFVDRDGNTKTYADTYILPVKTVAELFAEKGYYTCNSTQNAGQEVKEDYNFVYNSEVLYDGADWSGREEGQPFFAQVQLRGGKLRNVPKAYEEVLAGIHPELLVKEEDVTLPPYCPDIKVFRADWAEYLNSVIYTDIEVGKVLDRLEKDNLMGNTVIFFITDHGISTMRGKQYLYDEGIKVPLIVRYPDKRMAGTVRKDLVLQIDLVATSLKLAGINLPANVQGRNLFYEDDKKREFVVTARDRAGEAVDIIRSVRTKKYKYIRNFMSYQPHSVRDQYKDHYVFTKTLRKLNAEGKLTPLQSQYFTPTRPPEELYDLENDPLETINLANQAKYREVLFENRNRLYSWMIENKDMGLIPEPILEELGREYGNKYYILQQKENVNLIKQLIDVFEAGELKDVEKLEEIAKTGNPSQRYWAVTWLGVHRNQESAELIKELVKDNNATVKIAACLALCKMGMDETYLPIIVEEINHPNYLVGMYAIRAIEQSGILNEITKKAAEIAFRSKYDNTTRYGRRLLNKLGVRQENYYDEYVPEYYKYLYEPYTQIQPYIKQN